MANDYHEFGHRCRTLDSIGHFGRRDFLLGAAALAAGAGLPARKVQAAAGVETIDINSRLIEAARRENALMVRYSSPVDEMAEMTRPFQGVARDDGFHERR